MEARTYARLLNYARRRSGAADEAEDLLQYALVAAIEAQRADMTRSENRRWLVGVLRNRARHEARSAVRRRQREGAYVWGDLGPEAPGDEGAELLVAALPPALRTTALLALTGHTKPEIGWLLGLSDTALRKRLSDIRQRCRGSEANLRSLAGAPQGDLPFGILRKALIRRVRNGGVMFGSHDPDGHLFILSSQTEEPRQRMGVQHMEGDQIHVR
jgi:DNA-directed RNA polymerase specialized sigma24 family protein